MINSNELMLGNYVEVHGDFLKVELIAKDYLNCDDMELYYDEINPIPITEEILEKCGFHKRGNLFVNDFEDKIFQIGINEYQLLGLHKLFRYLHELQNIYFLYRKRTIKY